MLYAIETNVMPAETGSDISSRRDDDRMDVSRTRHTVKGDGIENGDGVAINQSVRSTFYTQRSEDISTDRWASRRSSSLMASSEPDASVIVVILDS